MNKLRRCRSICRRMDESPEEKELFIKEMNDHLAEGREVGFYPDPDQYEFILTMYCEDPQMAMVAEDMIWEEIVVSFLCLPGPAASTPSLALDVTAGSGAAQYMLDHPCTWGSIPCSRFRSLRMQTHSIVSFSYASGPLQFEFVSCA